MMQRSVAVVVLSIVALVGLVAPAAGAGGATAESPFLPGTIPYVLWDTADTASQPELVACGYTTTEAEEARAHKSDPDALARIVQRYERSVCVVAKFPADTDLAPLAQQVNVCLTKRDRGRGVPKAIVKGCVAPTNPSSMSGSSRHS
jgi:hypothetical protein